MPPATFPLAGTPFGNSDGDRSFSVAEAWWALGLSYYALSVPNINLAAAVDTLIPLPLPNGFANYLVDSAWIVNPSGNASSAKIGLFTQPNGGGTAIIAGGTAITAGTAAPNTAGNTQQIAPSTGNTQSFNAPTLYFRPTTAAPGAAAASLVLFIRALF
jgi:hypothetical protein